MASSLDIKNFTRSAPPAFPYAACAASALPGWEVSLAFAGERRAQAMNRALRGKDYVPNVLSYEVGKRSGEIVVCLAVARRQAPDYDLPYESFVPFLFIHGLLHLKGERHGARMEANERALLGRFTPATIHATKNRDRHRHRHPPGEGRGGRGGAGRARS